MIPRRVSLADLERARGQCSAYAHQLVGITLVLPRRGPGRRRVLRLMRIAARKSWNWGCYLARLEQRAASEADEAVTTSAIPPEGE